MKCTIIFSYSLRVVNEYNKFSEYIVSKGKPRPMGNFFPKLPTGLVFFTRTIQSYLIIRRINLMRSVVDALPFKRLLALARPAIRLDSPTQAVNHVSVKLSFQRSFPKF